MPYIRQERRPGLLDGYLRPSSSGDLNFIITSLVKSYIGPVFSYAAFNEAIGALECCKLELYRRMIAPYEDRKITENGDVYDAV